LASLDRARELAAVPGTYTLQAAIAACHARAFRAEDTDWGQMVEIYDQLASTMPSPIVELNRAVAVSKSAGPAVALDLVDQLRDTRLLDEYHLLHSVRGDLLSQLGRPAEAQVEFERAASLARNEQERRLTEQRAVAMSRLARD
jgi:predicted RNA polymerase sigma factor